MTGRKRFFSLLFTYFWGAVSSSDPHTYPKMTALCFNLHHSPVNDSNAQPIIDASHVSHPQFSVSPHMATFLWLKISSEINL